MCWHMFCPYTCKSDRRYMWTTAVVVDSLYGKTIAAHIPQSEGSHCWFYIEASLTLI